MASQKLTPLMQACKKGNAAEVKALIADKNTDIHERDDLDRTAIFYCVENVDTHCLSLLLESCLDIDFQDKNHYTCLHLAVTTGNKIIVEYLIKKGADINLKDTDAHSVIHWAVVCGQEHLITILLKHGANPNTSDIHGAYPIHYAAQMCGEVEIWDETISRDPVKSLNILKKLIDAKVRLDVEDKDQRNPILWAASSGSSDAVKWLFHAGCNPLTHEKDGLTALHCAASKGHWKCIKTLIDTCKCSVDMMDNNNCTPIFYTVVIGHAEACRILIEYGANLYVQDIKGRTVYHCAAARGQYECLETLLNENPNIWLRSRRGEYPIQEAFTNDHLDCVELFIDKCDSKKVCNSTNIYDGTSILHLAAAANNLKLCKRLVENGADMNALMKTSKNEYLTPHALAAARESVVCAVYLKTTADRMKKESMFAKPLKTLIEFSSTNKQQQLLSKSVIRDSDTSKLDTDADNESSNESRIKLTTSRKLKKTLTSKPVRTKNQSTKIFMTSNKNLNRIDTFYYENLKNKLIYPEVIKSEDEQDDAEQSNEKSKPPRSPLVFIKHGRRDKSYFLSNTVQIQCDMSDTDPESEPGETETETETEEEEPTPIPTPKPPTPEPKVVKEWVDPNIIHLTEDDAIIRLVFQKEGEPRKKNRTLYEKQRLVLKSLYDIRRARLNNMDILITKELDDILKRYKYDIKCRCRSLKDLERILEVLALAISNEYKKNHKNTNQPQLKRSKTLPDKPKITIEPVRKENTEHPTVDSENTRPVIIISKKPTDNSKAMKREKTEFVLKKSLTNAYKPVVPNDIYKKNYSTNTETPLYQQLSYNEHTPREKTLILPVIIPHHKN